MSSTSSGFVESVERWGRWLQILCAVGFIFDVFHALVAYAWLHMSMVGWQHGVIALLPQHFDLPCHVILPSRGTQRSLLLAATAGLAVPWWRATQALLTARFGTMSGPREALRRVESVRAVAHLAPRLLARLLVALVVAFAAGVVFEATCAAVRPGPSVGIPAVNLLFTLASAALSLVLALAVEVSRKIPLGAESPIEPGPAVPSRRADLAGSVVPAVAKLAPATSWQGGGAAAGLANDVGPTHAAARCLGCGGDDSADPCATCGARRAIGQYQVTAILAQRPHGRTYRATAPDGREVVIKEVVFARAPDVKTLSDVDREAMLLARLQHARLPSLIEHFNLGEGATRRDYLVMPYIDGEPLSQPLERGRVVPPPIVIAMVRQVLELLVVLQDLEPMVLHRDIKPANILRLRSGEIALVDFGAARDISQRHAEGTLVGTLGYMPREQLAGHVDATSDVYALAVTAIHLLTGKNPADLVDQNAHLQVPARLPVASPVTRVLARMAAPTPAKRYPDAKQALRAFDAATRPSRPTFALATIAASVLLAIGIAVGLLRHRDTGPKPAQRSGPAPASGDANSGAPDEDLTDPTVVAHFEHGGTLTRGELLTELWRLPASFQPRRLQGVKEVGLALIAWKRLAAEAARRGLAPAPSQVADPAAKARWQARELMVAEHLSPPPNPLSATALREHHQRYVALLQSISGGTNPTFDDAALGAIDLSRVRRGALPLWKPSRPLPFILASNPVDVCSGVVDPAGWYRATCQGGTEPFPELIPPEEVTYLEAVYGPPEADGFLHHTLFDGVTNFSIIDDGRARVPIDGYPRMPPADPPDVERHFGIELRHMTATLENVPPNTSLWAAASPALAACVSHAMWVNRYPVAEADFDLEVIDTPTGVRLSLDDSAFPHTDLEVWPLARCALPLGELYPAGVRRPAAANVEYTVHVTTLIRDDAHPSHARAVAAPSGQAILDVADGQFGPYRGLDYAAWMPAPRKTYYADMELQARGGPGRPAQRLRVGAQFVQSRLGGAVYTVERIHVPPLQWRGAYLNLLDDATRVFTFVDLYGKSIQLQQLQRGGKQLPRVKWVQGYPARDLLVPSPDGHHAYLTRTILMPDTLISLSVTLPAGGQLDADGHTFLEGVQLYGQSPALFRQIPKVGWLNCPLDTVVPDDGAALPECARVLPAGAFEELAPPAFPK